MRYRKVVLLLQLSSSILAGCSASASTPPNVVVAQQGEEQQEEGECLNNDDKGNKSSCPEDGDCLATPTPPLLTDEDDEDVDNGDDDDDNMTSCQKLASRGDCTRYQEYMFKHCPSDCMDREDLGKDGYFSTWEHVDDNGVDEEDYTCEDYIEDCEGFAKENECLISPDLMSKDCPKSCKICFRVNYYKIGVRQILKEEEEKDDDEEGEEEDSMEEEDPERLKEFLNLIQETNKYMEMVMKEEEYETIRLYCSNSDALCTKWAMEGYCDPPYNYDELDDDDELHIRYNKMMDDCSPVCQTCHELLLTDHELEEIEKCKANVETNAIESGDDLNNIFLRIVGELPFEEGIIVPDYDVTILSRPTDPSKKKDDGNEEENVEEEKDDDDDDDDGTTNRPLIGGPWVVTLDNFITDEECDRLIELGGLLGYKKSTLEGGEEESFEDDEIRTSTNTWCQDECADDPIAQRVMSKIANTTGIPDENSEELQLLRYVSGQYYNEHHDNDDSYYDYLYQPGPRLLTFFLYLNDVEEGGGTKFTDLTGSWNGSEVEMVVQPKKGRALVWPSVLSEDLYEPDQRTWHAALPVTKGKKFGANAWLHQRDFKNDECDYEFVKSIA